MKRRDFLRLAGWTGAGLTLVGSRSQAQPMVRAKVSLVRSGDRAQAVKRAVGLLGLNSFRDRTVVLKPNFNSAHTFPGSTHNDTLESLIETLLDQDARSLTVADRSGMGNTRTVMQQKGVFQLASRLGVEVVALDELPAAGWVHSAMPHTHWSRGLHFPRLFLDADSIVQTCCLKTHRYGGHFTLALKNSVGMVARVSPADRHDYMNQLHGSPQMRAMIAEINLLYRPDLIVLDGMEAFVDQGPETGTRAYPGVMMAGTDPVAVDAVGVAILRSLGTTPEVTLGEIFDQEQIRRAVELGLGVDAPEAIEVLVDDEDSSLFAQSLMPFLGMTVSVARPPLTIQRHAHAVEVSWPTWQGASRRLTATGNLSAQPQVWSEVTAPHMVDGSYSRVTLPLGPGQTYFRLE